MADTRLSDLSAAGALSASDLFYVVQTPGSGGEKATGTQLLTLVGTTYLAKAGGTMTGALTLPNGTATAPALNFASALTSGLYAIASNTLAFSANGTRHMYMSGSAIWSDVLIGFLNNSGGLRFGSSSNDDPLLIRQGDRAIQIAPASTTTPCSFIVSTLGGASTTNYERLTLTGVAGTSVNITAETLGTGADNINIVLTPAGTGVVSVPALVSATSFTCGNDVTMNFSSAGIRARSTGEYAWTAGNATAAADTALHRDSAGVAAVDNGTAGTYRDLKLRNLLAGGGNGSYVQTPSMTVANLAAAATAGAGARAFVTDANATTFLSTVAAGGANKVPVVSDGTNWLIG